MSGFRVYRVPQTDARRIRAQRGSATPKVMGGVLLGAAGAATGEGLFAHRKVNGATQLERAQSHLSTMTGITYAWHRALPALEGFGAVEGLYLLGMGLVAAFSRGRKTALQVQRATGRDVPGAVELPQILKRQSGPHSIAVSFAGGSIPVSVVQPQAGASPLAKGLKEGERIYLISEAYKIEGKLGMGGMGRVWKARSDSGKTIAIKELTIDNPDARARFKREADVVSGIGRLPRRQDGEWDPKDGVVGYEGFIEVPGTNICYLFMEFVDGKPLGEFCEDLRNAYLRDLTIETGAKLRQVQLAIVTLFHYMNLSLQEVFVKNRIIHRDLKLDNVLVAIDAKGNARPKILDWGLAKDVSENITEVGKEGLTQDGSLMGTMSYAAPEVFWAYLGHDPEGKPFDRKEITIQADMYSLGVMLYSVLVGKHPFRYQDQKVDFFLLHTSKQEPQLVIPEIIPPRTGELLRRLLARRPQDRPQDNAELNTLIVAAESEIRG